MKTFSIEARLEGRAVIVVGACGECAMKIERLVDAGANVLVFSVGVSDPRIDALVESGRVTMRRDALGEDDLKGAMLAYVSPTLDCPELLRRWEARGHFLCHLDRPETGSFINPASTQRGRVRFTVSTGGAAPALARRFRECLDESAGNPSLDAFVDELSALRERTPSGERRAVLSERLEGFVMRVSLEFPSWFVEER